MSRLADRAERDLREIAAGARPSPSAWDSIVARLDDDARSEVALALAPVAERSTRAVWLSVAAAVLVVVVGAVAVLTAAGDDDSISTIDQGSTATFVSPRNGFSVEHSDAGEGAVTPAEQLWGFSGQVDDGFDVVEAGSAAVFRGASTDFPGDGPCLSAEYEPSPCGSIDEQVDRYLAEDNVWPGGCGVPRSQQAEITIDGRAGRVAECTNQIEATVVFGGRLYLFSLSHDRSDARSLFDALVATIDLTPETAIDLPGLTTTFASEKYGYSFRYHDRGGLVPATELWDPSSQPLDDIDFDPRFDAVETGLAAYLEGASTPIPDGTSIDEWVDEVVTPRVAGGCGVPRGQQAEITVDGRAGRVAECATRVEATVAAGGRLYLFTLSHSRGDARAFFDAWIATISLTPETASVP